ncbi:arylesterase [Shewanella sp. NFH-SH190041]|uniref:arylesterase n=1 Tax=Shewanella sp. NFH-SH190041 TaxID=2950245 RepID=UPI0021C34A3D|nr:arylesterase [Shewanella sp. NFH-SH190041]BDM64741.1 arylesterase [Shewanella sp. NFH-SH190041]
MVHNPAWSASILILGDSLSAAYGIPEQQGWVAKLQQQLPQHQIINGSVSGETSAGGLRRLPALLDSATPDILLVELGGNDGLRGFSPAALKSNLTKIIELGQANGALVLLTEMMVPPNYGRRYSRQFNGVYHDLSEQFAIPLIPFFMTEIAIDSSLMQRDGIHPNATAQPKITQWMEPWISSALEQIE